MNKSFTLIEILVVIVIVGILSAFIIVSMAGVSSKATIAKGQAFSNSLKNSLMMNLVSEWKMDGNADDAWGSNNGTLVGPTHLPVAKSGSDCVSGGCYQFDGTEDYINCGNGTTLNIANAITLEAWIKPSAISGSQDIIAKPSNYVLELKPTGKITMALSTNEGWHFTLDSIAGLSSGNWYHVVGSYSSAGAVVKFYINGVLDRTDTTSTSGMITTSANNLNLAYYNSGFPNRFGGLMDEVRLYNESVPVSEIQQKYYTGLNKLLVGGNFFKEEYRQRLGELKMNLVDND